ncbi:3574_t:CDS:2 [Paraglomus brasilianum]|uniref:Queuine tRNA-ribosyltransferase accessory subunit 2 n=1 Tax=Paraglomus brasilianum TaxID=144538 RepID=A0A9N9A4K4_9GLOM|nr:3574_t:CDS:2 [Paraglomus brasilianum]
MPPLLFTLLNNEISLRLGRLSLASKILDTPNCILNTVRGSVLHLTPDNLRLLPFQAVGITLEQFLDVQPPASTKFPGGAHEFFNFQEYLLYVDIHDPAKQIKARVNSDKFISVRTHQGIRQLTLADYLSYMNAYKPDFFAAFSDSLIQKNHGDKRVQKSIDRTLKWLDDTLDRVEEDTNVFGVLGGHGIREERVRSAHETAKRKVAGFLLNVSEIGDTSEERLDLLRTSLSHLPQEKPRLVYGLGTPGDILRAVSEGADLFDTSYPSEMANNGHAFTFKFATDSNASDMTLSMNLWDKSFARDFQPFVPSCECHACQNYTRAYTHHLLIAHEMLANVLLISHNLFVYGRFFERIRNSIKMKTFDEDMRQFLHRYEGQAQIEHSMERDTEPKTKELIIN